MSLQKMFQETDLPKMSQILKLTHAWNDNNFKENMFFYVSSH